MGKTGDYLCSKVAWGISPLHLHSWLLSVFSEAQHISSPHLTSMPRSSYSSRLKAQVCVTFWLGLRRKGKKNIYEQKKRVNNVMSWKNMWTFIVEHLPESRSFMITTVTTGILPFLKKKNYEFWLYTCSILDQCDQSCKRVWRQTHGINQLDLNTGPKTTQPSWPCKKNPRAWWKKSVTFCMISIIFFWNPSFLEEIDRCKSDISYLNHPTWPGRCPNAGGHGQSM